MKRRNQVLAAAILCTTGVTGHAAGEYMQPNMPMYMGGPYPPPMYPMHQQPHQAMPVPADNPSEAQSANDTKTQQVASASTRPEYCQHKSHQDTSIYKIRAMQRQQDKMQTHMQRMENHLANIEGLIRQMVENR
ncbi:MAG: hypothetical protein OQL16_04525 [Gammaproteobacteria bacterium]|nr:hypothetical protein [Gammaproteobacteria bacterium]